MYKKIVLVLYVLWIKARYFFSFKKQIPRLLIIKIDAIGDYILFRNYLNEIAKSPKYNGHKITLVGNIILKELILELDSNILENYIFIDHNPARKDWFLLLKDVTRFKYDTVINFHYSRTPTTELIILAATAKEKIAINGDNIRIKAYAKILCNLFYSSVVNIPQILESEFDFNGFFTESVIGYKLNKNYPQIRLQNNRNIESVIESPYIVLSPGAGVESRRLDTETLIKLTSFLLKKYTVCFVGSAQDTLIVNEIKAKLPQPFAGKLIDITGKTSLKDLPYILNNSLCVICNDSGIYHMSVALNKIVLCIAGGGHFKRFVQYKERANIIVCYVPMPCYNCNWKCIYKFPLNTPYPCIGSIEINYLLEKFEIVEKLLKDKDFKESDYLIN